MMVIQDVFWPHDVFHFSVGDLFVTSLALVLIELAECERMGTRLGAIGGLLVGGRVGAVAGGMVISRSDKDSLASAGLKVKTALAAEFAMSFEERLRKHPAAIVLPQDEIYSLGTNKKNRERSR